MANPWQPPQQMPQPAQTTQAAQTPAPAKPKLTREQRKAARGETYPYNLFFVADQQVGGKALEFISVSAVLVLGPQLIQFQYQPSGMNPVFRVTKARSIIRPWSIALWLVPAKPTETSQPAKPFKVQMWMYRPGERGRLDVERTDPRCCAELQLLRQMSEIANGEDFVFMIGLAFAKLVTRLVLLLSMPFAIGRIRQRIAIAKRFREQLGL